MVGGRASDVVGNNWCTGCYLDLSKMPALLAVSSHRGAALERAREVKKHKDDASLRVLNSGDGDWD